MSATHSSKTKSGRPGAGDRITVERVQTGIRVERRLLKVLKGLAEYHDITLGDLLEGICLHAIEGKVPFGKESLSIAAELKRLYGLDFGAGASHRMAEAARSREGRISRK
jgi:hypothetical protein